MKSYGIHWFRRDLRVAGNIGLKENFKVNDGRVVGLFCFDKNFLSRGDFSVHRFQIFLGTLKSLKTELQDLGSDLLFLDVGPQDSFPDLFENLKRNEKPLPNLMTWGRDYEPFARNRDRQMEDIFGQAKVPWKNYRDHLTIEPDELVKEDGSGDGYQVYTPFSRKWLRLFACEDVERRIEAQKPGLKYMKKRASGQIEARFQLTWSDLLPESTYPDNLQAYIDENQKQVEIPIPKVGTAAVYQALEDFKPKLDDYGKKRDFPDISGTSRFSMYLKNGSLTVPQIIAHYGLEPYDKKKSGRDIFFSELIWREFYYHVLFRNPEVETSAFLEKFRNLEWGNNEKWFQKWKDGETGFPIVDAGMRELKTTGWMHNRVRMIVASFLTKDLLIDWRWGEKHFMDKLLDGDLAPNNGGWQWAASTGCDPQPFFRIFNPWSQSVKFDKEGAYIKTYVPELKDLPAQALHKPIEGHESYPEPIVDHSVQRKLALDLYRTAHEASKP